MNVESPRIEWCLMNKNSYFFSVTNLPVCAKDMNLMSHKHLLNVLSQIIINEKLSEL